MDNEKSNSLNNTRPSITEMAKVLITPIYSTDSIVLAINRFSIDRLFLLVSKKSDEEQQKAVKEIQEHYSKIIDIKEKKIELYDLVEAAHQVKEIIDDQGSNDEIYLNITTGSRPQAMGVLFAGYKRPARVKKIFYVTEDTNEIITIPKLSFEVTEAQQKILDNIENVDKISEMENEIDVSKAMIYRAIIELKNKGFIEENTDKGYRLTEAGKIAKM
jgi:CRISPR locus-related DNA-binding protein